MTNLETSIRDIQGDLKDFIGRQTKRLDDMQSQLDAVDTRMQRASWAADHTEQKSTVSEVIKAIQEDGGFDMLRKNGRGRSIITVPNLLQLKSAITSGSLVPYDAERGIAPGARRRYRLREIIPSRPISTGSAFFVRETAFATNASPQALEGDSKTESTFTFTGDTVDVRTIAHVTHASKQILDDMVEMGEHIRTSLIYGLEARFEDALLNDSGTNGELDGLLLTAENFDTSLLVGSDGWEYIDQLRLAALQLEEAGYECTAFVVPPRIWARMELQKNANGDYINGSPTAAAMREVVWSRPVIPSHAIPSGTFLAGDFANGCHIRMRMESTIDISDQHDQNFVKNLLTLRGEMRACLVKTKPSSFVKGTFSQSPA